MEHPLPHPEALVRPWRTAALVAAGVATLELVLLLAIGGGMLLGAVSERVRSAARERVLAPTAERSSAPARPHTRRPASVPPQLPRSRTVVLVLNGNGRTGAAAAAAERVRRRGYRVGGVGNADRTDFPRSLVMYRPGFAAEGRRLAHDLGLRSAGPLDGMRPRALGRAHVVLVVGAR